MAAEFLWATRVSLAVMGLALVAACNGGAPELATTGELDVHWQGQPDSVASTPALEVEVRRLDDEASVRRSLVLGPSELEARLSLPPGLYTVQLHSPARPALLASAGAAGSTLDMPLELPPPSVVLVSRAGSTRARVGIEMAEAGPVARVR